VENATESKWLRRQAAQKKYRLAHPDRIRAKMKKLNADGRYKGKRLSWREDNLRRVMFYDARKRAKKKGHEFSITLDDIHIPLSCPVLLIELNYGVGKRTEHSPSLDRIDNTRGYVKGNVAVISWRANRIKSNVTAVDLRNVANWMDDQRAKEP
jgi:hypothetical protein